MREYYDTETKGTTAFSDLKALGTTTRPGGH